MNETSIQQLESEVEECVVDTGSVATPPPPHSHDQPDLRPARRTRRFLSARDDAEAESEGHWKLGDYLGGRRFRMSFTAQKINIGDRVIVTNGRSRGEIGVVKRSGHGFYCVSMRGRGEIMKRANELEPFTGSYVCRPPSPRERKSTGGAEPGTPVTPHRRFPLHQYRPQHAASILMELAHDHADTNWTSVDEYDAMMSARASSTPSPFHAGDPLLSPASLQQQQESASSGSTFISPCTLAEEAPSSPAGVSSGSRKRSLDFATPSSRASSPLTSDQGGSPLSPSHLTLGEGALPLEPCVMPPPAKQSRSIVSASPPAPLDLSSVSRSVARNLFAHDSLSPRAAAAVAASPVARTLFATQERFEVANASASVVSPPSSPQEAVYRFEIAPPSKQHGVVAFTAPQRPSAPLPFSPPLLSRSEVHRRNAPFTTTAAGMSVSGMTRFTAHPPSPTGVAAPTPTTPVKAKKAALIAFNSAAEDFSHPSPSRPAFTAFARVAPAVQ